MVLSNPICGNLLKQCYGLKVCVPFKFICAVLMVSGGVAYGKYLCHEGGALMNGICALN